mgnify:CR=1 FL=1
MQGERGEGVAQRRGDAFVHGGGVVDAHAYAHHEIGALSLAEEVARRELGLPAEAKLIATIGQIGLRKGQDVLARAAAAVRTR